jgi:hypothetical protein
VTKQTPECVVHPNGSRRWYLNDKLHREDGPAIEYSNGDKHWFLNDKLHREEGPAIEYLDGDKDWFLNGELYSPQQYATQVVQYGVLCWWNETEKEMVFL